MSVFALKRAYACRDGHHRKYGDGGGDNRQGQTYSVQRNLVRHGCSPLEAFFCGRTVLPRVRSYWQKVGAIRSDKKRPPTQGRIGGAT